MRPNNLNECVKLLEKQANQTFKDRDYQELVNYINCFLKHFGTERICLVGSTAERLKVTTNKDFGDADILLLSGKLEVPAENIKFRNDTPCFIRIKVDKAKISTTINLIDGIYLPSDVLRSVRPELFTILRGIYLLFKCGTSYSPLNTTNTTLNVTSNVGLAMIEYSDLDVEKGMSTSTRTCSPKRQVKTHNESFKAYIKKRKSDIEFYKQDVEMVERLMEFICYMRTQCNTGDYRFMLLEHFAYFVSLLQERLKESSLEESSGEEVDSDVETSAVTFENDLESVSDDPPCSGGTHVSNESMEFETSQRKFRATCKRIRHIDVVPALKIIGSLACMEVWKTAEHMWLSQGEIYAIAKMDVFCVARYAPVNPSSKDFCLSFTLAENKLSECLSPVQRHIVLTMKAFLKGLFTKRHKQRDHVLKLTTFHVKTVIYRVSDVSEPSLWSEDNVAASLTRVLTYLKEALRKKELLHFFMQSNLFSGFEDEDFNILLECTDEAISEPLSGLNAFFELNNFVPIEVWLTEEDVAYLKRSSTDDGISEVVDIMEESIVEFLRGLKEGPRDEKGNAPIMEAFAAIINKCCLQFSQVIPIENLMLTSFEKILKPNSEEEEKQLAFQLLKTLGVAYILR